MALLAACVRRGLKVLSATGAGARADPTRIRLADLRESTNDPLSRAVSTDTCLIFLSTSWLRYFYAPLCVLCFFIGINYIFLSFILNF